MLVRMRCFVISGMFLLAGCSSSGAALAINIEKGDSRDPVSGQFHNAAIASALMAAQFYGMSGFATMDEGGSYYALLGTTLAHYDMGNRSLLGTWPLTRWEGDTYLPDEITTEYAIYGIEPDSEDFYPASLAVYAAEQADQQFGCLTSAPLRYGDFTGDGSAEVVLMGDDIAVFSTQKQKIIFTQRIRLNDWMSADEQERVYGEDFAELMMLHEEDYPQYFSQMTYDRMSGPKLPASIAYRGYGKLFHGEFSGEGHRDVLAWHKFYGSLMSSSETQGFERISEAFVHYRLVNGDYQREDTPEATIRSWLATNNLTWQSGFPSHSECPGHEGQLIPEMHDPLLNDPDVLQ